MKREAPAAGEEEEEEAEEEKKGIHGVPANKRRMTASGAAVTVNATGNATDDAIASFRPGLFDPESIEAISREYHAAQP